MQLCVNALDLNGSGERNGSVDSIRNGKKGLNGNSRSGVLKFSSYENVDIPSTRPITMKKKSLIILAIFLILPMIAVARVWFVKGWIWVPLYWILISVIALTLYYHDKRRARTEGWRTPEWVLHLIELLGGWHAAYVAQQFFGHKIAKRTYQIIFWCIGVLQNLVCLDFLLEWSITGYLFGRLFGGT